MHLRPLADVAERNVVSNILSKALPDVFNLDDLRGSLAAIVARGRIIVIAAKDFFLQCSGA